MRHFIENKQKMKKITMDFGKEEEEEKTKMKYNDP
jgi:hypothetical protein